MHRTLPERLISFAIRHARAVVLLTFAVTIVLAWFALRVRINPDFFSLLPQDAAVNKLLKEYGADLSQPDVLVFAVSGADVHAEPALAAFGEAVDGISALKGIRSAITPFSLVSFGRVDGRLAIRPMSPGGGTPTAETAAEFRARLQAAAYAKNLVVSADGTMLISLFQVESMGSFSAFMAQVTPLTERVRSAGLTPYVTGTIPLSVSTEGHLAQDSSRLLVLAALIILLSYAVGYRSLRAVALPLLSVVLGTVWTVGFMGIVGFSLSLITIVAPPLILIFGNEYTIFTTSEYLRLGREHATAPGWIARAVRNVSKPVAMAFFTTTIGFLSLLSTSIRQTREFAIVASVGSLVCAFLALFFLPAFYSLLKPPVVRTHHPDGFLQRGMRATARFSFRYPVIVLTLLAGIGLLFALALPHLKFNTDPASYFPAGDPVLRDMTAIYRKAGGYEQAAVSFDAPAGRTGYFLDAAALAEVERVENKLREIPDISYALSLPDLLRGINKAATGEDALPSNRAVVSTFARLLAAAGGSSAGGSLLANLASRDFTRVTVTFRVYNSDTGHYMDEARMRALFARMQRTLDENPVSSTPVLWSDMQRNLAFADSLRTTLLLSMAISFFSILALTVIVFRSLLFGLYPMLPLLAGLLLNYAMMAITGIPLDMTTIMVSNIAIGVGVDSAIYVVIQYRRQLARSPRDPARAVQETLVVVGQPVMLSSLSIMFGMLVFATASFRPVVYFGMLVLFTLAATTVGTLVTLPTLLGLDTRIRLARAERRAHRLDDGPSAI
jgi:predicted RND superfamily exporter protein